MDSSEGQSALVAEPPSKESSKVTAFRYCYFQGIKDNQWNDWRWQLRNKFTTIGSISSIIQLSDDEILAMEDLSTSGRLAANITPYYLSLISPDDARQPLRRTVIPSLEEFRNCKDEYEDPLHEDNDSPVPGIVHRYDDRVLMLVSGHCASNCRYCTRSRLVGAHKINHIATEQQLIAAINYISGNCKIRDVLISGGDPLLLDNNALKRILEKLRAIEHIEIIRIGTKVPAVLPQRITPNLVDILKKFHPLFMSLHFTHPDECTFECAKACSRLADAGIPLGSQTVLLSGINDSVKIMTSLMHKLLMMRVRPYYLYQCDPVFGTTHFRTPIEKGIEIIAGMRGFTSGYAVPTFVIDAPGGGGKIPLQQNYVVSSDRCGVELKNFRGGIYHYP